MLQLAAVAADGACGRVQLEFEPTRPAESLQQQRLQLCDDSVQLHPFELGVDRATPPEHEQLAHQGRGTLGGVADLL
ncbi:MAG: hypothetical protein KatS3mg102_1753 [Planctomycetota bacterium]|nr:MAG: hypothetical protein KatS3mg102_1753 [Planctomycetota bacterium]